MQQQNPQIIIQRDDAPKIIPPVASTPMTPEEFAKGEDTVTMYFEQKKTLFTTPEGHGKQVLYPQGAHEVPRRYADHWFLVNSGARLYNRPVPAGPALKVDSSPSTAPARSRNK